MVSEKDEANKEVLEKLEDMRPTDEDEAEFVGADIEADIEADVDGEDGEEEGAATSSEVAAAADGHVSKEVWEKSGKAPGDWVDAKTFLMRGELFGKIRDQNRRLSDMSKSLKVMTDLYKTAEETGAKKAVEELKRQKVSAMEDGDFVKAAELDEQLSEVKKPSKIDELTAVDRDSSDLDTRIKEYYVNWIPQNSWYTKDKVLATYADSVAQQYITEQGAQIAAEDLFRHVASVVRKDNPEKFENTHRQMKGKAAPTGRTTSNVAKSNSKVSTRDLSVEERKIGSNLVNDGAFKDLQAFAEARFASNRVRGIHPRGAATAIFE